VERGAESRQALEAEIRARLIATREAAEGALARAKASHADGLEAVRSEIERLERLRKEAVASVAAR
jgi:hypothetical protein